MEVKLAFSADSDDIFMFWALLNARIDTGMYDFVVERGDTQVLNERAARGDIDVIAVSIARYAAIANEYMLLPHGASVGRGYGPALVAKGPRSLESLRGARIGVPGLTTTAYWALRIVFPEFDPVVLPIVPFSRAFEAVANDEVDAALLIHEGRLTFEDAGLHMVADLGVLWTDATGMPLPLGGNAIARQLGSKHIEAISKLCRASIVYALTHRGEVMAALLSEEARADLSLSRERLDRYLAMYANEDTRATAPDVKVAIADLFTRARAAGLIENEVTLTFAP